MDGFKFVVTAAVGNHGVLACVVGRLACVVATFRDRRAGRLLVGVGQVAGAARTRRSVALGKVGEIGK